MLYYNLKSLNKLNIAKKSKQLPFISIAAPSFGLLISNS